MFNNKKIILFFLLFSFIAFSLFVFKAYNFSSEYKNNKSYLLNVNILEQLELLLALISKEKKITVTYLNRQNEKNFNSVDVARKATNLKIQELIITNTRTQNFDSFIKSLKDISSELRAIHLQVDSANIKSSQDYYKNQTTKHIQKLITQLRSDFPFEYTELVKQKNQLEKEVFIYVLVTILFLVLMFFLLYWFKAIKKHNTELVATLKEIEEELSDKQRLGIQEVLKKNNPLEVYKFLAQTIKEPSRAKDNFLANISHEVRTPLNGIIGFTSLLEATELNDEQTEFLGVIAESSNNLLTIIDDILDFSKLNSAYLELENSSFNIIDKVEKTIESYDEKVRKKEIELALFLDPQLPKNVLGDATRISQVLLNILDNAVKFTPKKGGITVSISLRSQIFQEAVIRFSVEDTGIGIPKNKQSQIFDAFSQVDVSSNRKFGGTGLGLTISKKFIELMGGTLALISEKGKGSTFYFDLILEIDNQKTDISPPLNNVLLYKRNKLSGKIYYSMLESLGYEVDIYDSIYAFKRQLESKKYKYAFFDDKNTNNELMAKVIKKNGAIPFLFSEEKENNDYCQVLDSSIDANSLSEHLKHA